MKGSGQHDEFDTEEKMTERTVEDVDWRIDGETVSLTWATEDGDEGTYDLVVITDDEGAKLPGWRESDLPTTNTEVVNYREGNMKEYDLIITVPGRTVEQDSYREGDDAEYSKKTWGQPSFDDLEMERGVKPGDTKMHDWFEDVRAGSADSATKEISVRMQNEEGGGKIDIAFIHADGSVSSYRLDVDGDSEPSEDESNGGDPQTGKEIKIPANLKGGTVSNTILAGIIDKEEVERGKVVAVAAIKNAGNGPRCKIPVGLKDEEHQRPSAGDGPACDVPIG